MRTEIAFTAILFVAVALGGPRASFAQRQPDRLGERLDSYLFYYGDSHDAGKQTVPRLPPTAVLEMVADSWASYLERYPPLRPFTKKGVWSLEFIEASKANGWQTVVTLHGIPSNTFFTGPPFAVQLLVDSEGVKWPDLSLYDRAGPFDGKYIQSELAVGDKLKITDVDRGVAMQLANERLNELCNKPELSNLVVVDEHLNSHRVSMKLTAEQAEKIEISNGVFLWSVLAGHAFVGESGAVLDSGEETLQIWVANRTDISQLSVTDDRSRLKRP